MSEQHPENAQNDPAVDAGGEEYAAELGQELADLDDPGAGVDPNNEDSDGAAEDDAEDDGEALPDDAPGDH